MTSLATPETQVAFSMYENRGVFALILGSGLSRSAEIPTGWEITIDLVRRVAEAEGVKDQADWPQWYRDQHGEEPDYSALLEQLAPTPAMRRSILHSYIEPDEQDRDEGRKLPTAGHKAIAQLVRDGFVRVIVTTNFDRLMENALREVGVEPTIVGSVDALNGAEPMTHSACYILKLHGDYKDTRILNTNDELTGYPPKYDAMLDRIIDEYGLIVCGWSGEWDYALRAALLRAPSRRYPLYWATRTELKGKGKELCDHRKGLQVLIADADKFFSGLAEQVRTLSDSRRKNPADIDLLVARAKRYLSKPEYTIQLSDLIEEEVKRTIDALQASSLSSHDLYVAKEFQRRVRQYESATEGLAKLSGLIGRWGEGSHMRVLVEAVRTLVEYGKVVNGGSVVYVEERRYPAVLVCQAMALGLVKSQHWQMFRDFLRVGIDTGYEGRKPAFEAVYPLMWEGGRKEVWSKLELYENHYIPLSDYLHGDVFMRWGSSFMASMNGFTAIYDMAEVLAAFVAVEHVTKVDLKITLDELDDYNKPKLFFMPIGRVGYHRESRNEVMAKFEDQTFLDDLAKAGFGYGDPEMISLIFENYTRNLARTRMR